MSDITSLTDKFSSIDLSTVETSFPVLKPGVINTLIASAEDKLDDKVDAKPYVEMKYTTTQDWATQPIDGRPSKPVLAGFTIIQRIYIVDFEDKKTGKIGNVGIVELAKIRENIFGPAKPGDRISLPELVGQPITLRLAFDPDAKDKKTGKSFGPQTSVAGYVRQNRG